MSSVKRQLVPKKTFEYVPRDQFVPFHNRTQRWAILRCHRRAGKTVACVNDLVLRAVYTQKKRAQFAYIAPFRQQAKQIAWAYLLEATEGIVDEVRESELSVKFPNGAKIMLAGSDSPDSLRGNFYDGAILDEYADMRPSLFAEVILPALADRQGWCVLCGTPKGRNNQFYEAHQRALNSDLWFEMSLLASTSGLLPQEELDRLKETMTEGQYAQEMECSFDASLLGTYYSEIVQMIDSKGQITPEVTFDPEFPVSVSTDLGFTDSTVLWFYQERPDGLAIIDCEEGHGQPLQYYFDLLRAKPYSYQKIWLPHDAKAKTLQTGKSTIEQFVAEEFPVQIAPNLKVQHGIDAVRLTLPYCWFNPNTCGVGIEALRSYRRRYDDINRVYTNTPLHDWASDFADSFRYLALVANKAKKEAPSPYLDDKGQLPMPEMSLDQLYADKARGTAKRYAKMRI